jgi:hypothetical protein
VDAGWRAEQVRRIQANHRRWLVMWSPYRRAFTAFSCLPDHALPIDEPTPERLVARICAVEFAYDHSRLPQIIPPFFGENRFPDE